MGIPLNLHTLPPGLKKSQVHPLEGEICIIIIFYNVTTIYMWNIIGQESLFILETWFWSCAIFHIFFGQFWSIFRHFCSFWRFSRKKALQTQFLPNFQFFCFFGVIQWLPINKNCPQFSIWKKWFFDLYSPYLLALWVFIQILTPTPLNTSEETLDYENLDFEMAVMDFST